MFFEILHRSLKVNKKGGDSITESSKEGFWLIPYQVGTDSALTLQDKLLYGQILSLTKKSGFCFANNSYLSELNNVTPKTISNSIANLKKNNYIRVEYHKEETNKYKRKIFMTDKVVWKINSGGIEKNVNTSMEDNYYHNNIKNKKRNKYNTNNNVPWWLDKDIEPNLATLEEQAEMEKLLSEFKN